MPMPYENIVYYDFKDFPDKKWDPYLDKKKCPPSSYYDARDMEVGEKIDKVLKAGTI